MKIRKAEKNNVYVIKEKAMKVFGFVFSVLVAIVGGYLLCHYHVLEMFIDFLSNVVGPAIGM